MIDYQVPNNNEGPMMTEIVPSGNSAINSNFTSFGRFEYSCVCPDVCPQPSSMCKEEFMPENTFLVLSAVVVLLLIVIILMLCSVRRYVKNKNYAERPVVAQHQVADDHGPFR